MKVCKSLKSRSRDVRSVARDTLLLMIQALGPRYLHYMISEMKESLTRGYQVSLSYIHVRCIIMVYFCTLYILQLYTCTCKYYISNMYMLINL